MVIYDLNIWFLFLKLVLVPSPNQTVFLNPVWPFSCQTSLDFIETSGGDSMDHETEEGASVS